MRMLGIDTCGERMTVVLAENGVPSDSRFADVPKRHSEALIPKLDEMLRANGLALSDVDCFGVVRGAGSFTGIRVGISTVKAFCYALGKPAVQVTSLECLAYNGGKDENVVAATDAKQGKLYMQAFEGIRKLTEIRVVERGEAAAFLAGYPGFVVRSDFDLSGIAPGFRRESDVSLGFARAMALAAPISGSWLTPLYVRPSQADEGGRAV